MLITGIIHCHSVGIILSVLVQQSHVQGALQYKGFSIHGRTIQRRRTIHDQYKFPRFDTTVWHTIQDRAPPLTPSRAVRVNLHCSAPCTTGVCEQIIPFAQASPCPAVQQQKLLSSPWFGALKADIPMCVIFQWSVFFTETGSTSNHLSSEQMHSNGYSGNGNSSNTIYSNSSAPCTTAAWRQFVPLEMSTRRTIMAEASGDTYVLCGFFERSISLLLQRAKWDKTFVTVI